jgi:autotransporter-associated beta strand protein
MQVFLSHFFRRFFAAPVLGKCLLLAVVLMLMAEAAQGQSKNSIASGNWNNPAIWSPAGVPDGTVLTVINPAHTVTLTGPITHAELVRVNGIMNLAGFAFNIGDLDGTGTVTSTPAATLTVGSKSSPGTFSGAINGAITLAKTGTEVLTISGTSAYTGATQVQQGTLRVVNNSSLGATSLVTVSSGATLMVSGGFTTDRNVTLNGTGVGGNGALLNEAGTNILSGTITLASAASISVASGTLSLTNAAAINMSTFDLTFNNPGSATISGGIAGSGVFTKTGAGVLTLSSANSFSGDKVISAGAINVQNATALGSAGAITVNSGAALQIQGGITFARPVTANGTGISNTGAIRNISGNNTLSGLITLASAARIQSDANTLTLSAATAISATDQNLTLGGSGAMSISGIIATGSGTLTKENGGTVTLTATNTYTGGTNINDGAINIQNAGALGSSGTITVNNGGTLQLQNNITLARPVTINGNGDGTNTGAIRSISGTNAISSTITLASAARINCDAGTLTLSNANSVTSTNQSLTIGGAATTTVSGTITIGSGSLTKDGQGAATISVANTYTGNTTINDGALIPSVANAFGTTGNVIVNNNGTLRFNTLITFSRPVSITGAGRSNVGAIQHVTGGATLASNVTITGNARINSDAGTFILSNAGTISGTSQALTLGGAGNMTFNRAIGLTTGTVTKDGAGTVTLNEQSTYTGVTTISAGTLIYGDNNIVGTGNLTVTGGTLNIGAFNDTVAVFSVSGTAVVTGTGTIFAQGDYAFQGGTIGINLGGDVGLIKSGTGTATLTGANSFTGQVWIQNGTLSVSSMNTWPSPSATSNLGSPNSEFNATIRLGSTNTTGVLVYTGAGSTVGRNLELAGTIGGGTITHNGSGVLTFSGSMTATGSGNKTFTLGGTNTANNVFNPDIPDGPSGITSLTKTDVGRWVLPNAKTNTGNSTISAGTLLIQDGSALGAAGTVSISANAAIELEGGITLNQNITLAGAPPGTGAIRSISGNNTIVGTINATAAPGGGGTATHRIQVESGSQLTYAGTPAFDHSTRIITFQGAGNHVVPLGSNFIGSTGSLTKEGSGTLTMNGSRFTTGPTTLTAGTIVLGGNNRFDPASLLTVNGGTFNLNGFSQTVNGLAGTGGNITTTVAATCSLIIDNSSGTTRAYSGTINHSVGVITVRKLGTTDQTLSGTSNFTGQVYIRDGRLIVTGVIDSTGLNSSLGRGSSSAPIVIENGQLRYNSATPRGTNRAIQLINNGALENQGTGALTLTGGITGTNTPLTFNVIGSGNLIVTTTGINIGSGSITKTSGGVVQLNAPNTYSGATIITTGTIQVGNATAISASSRLTNNATLNMNIYNVQVAGIQGTAAGALVQASSGTRTFTISSTGTDTLNYAGRIVNGGGTVAVTKAGTYTQVFSGNNAYSGITNINGGVLRANSSTAFSSASRHNLANVAGVELDMTGYDMALQSIEGGGATGGTVTLGTALLRLTASSLTYTYSGRILGDGLAGGIQKEGSGIFILANSPEYEGFTRVRAGVLRAGADIDFAGTLIIVDSTAGTRFDCGTFASSAPFLSFNSTRQVGGTWGSLSSAATNRTDARFTSGSSGTIFINDGRREGYWLGTVSSNWFTPGNWHDNIVPTSTTEVVLEDMSINAPVLNGTGNCGNLIILPGANLTLQGTSTLNVYLEIFNNGVLIPNSSTVVLRRTTGITRVIARPNGVDPDFARVEYLGTGTVRFQTSVANPVYLTGSLVNSSTGTIDFRGKNFRCGLLEGTGTLTNSLGFPTIINIEAATGTGTFSGVINNGVGGISIVKSGLSTQTLSGTNTFVNGVTVNGGTLRVLDNAAALGTGILTLGGTTPTLELSRTSAGTLTLVNNVVVSANATVITNVNTLGAGTAFTLGTLSIGANTLTVQGGANVNAGTATLAFGSVTHTGIPTYTVTNPLSGGLTRLSLGTLTGSTFRTFFNGNGEVVQSGIWTIATAANDSAITYNGTGSLTLNQANALFDRISLQSGLLIASENAGALGTATILLRGGRLRLQGDAPVNFGRVILKQNDLGWIESGRLTPGPGVTHIMGNLTLQNSGTDSVLIDAGPNVTSGIAGVDVATLTTTTGTTHVIDTNALLSITSMSGNHALTKRGLGQTRVTGAVTGTRTAATTVTQGSLRIELSNSLSSGTGTLNLDSGSVLELAGDANTTFNGTSVLLRGTSQIIRIDRVTPAATEVTHTLTNLSWNANNLELEVQRGNNISGSALGILSMTALTQNTGSRTYNYLTRPFARVSWPSYNVSAGGVVVNHRGQGILGQLNGTVLTTLSGTIFNQLGGGQLWLNGNNGTLQTTLNIDSGQLVLEGRQQVRIISLNAVGQVNPLSDTSFALSMAFAGVRQAPRLYGSTASTAQFQDDTRFTPGSTGLLGLKGYLEFRTNPAGGRSSLLLATAPVIQVRDSTGLLISNAQNTIPVRAFLSQTDTLGRGILRGDSVENMVVDSVRFDSLRLGGIVGFFYRIAFIVDSLVTPAIESPNLTLSPGPIDPSKSSVIFSVDTAIANGRDSALITVLIQDIDENKIINEEVFVTQPPGKLATITALNAGLSNVNGIAIFSVKATVADSIDFKAIVQVDDDEPFGDSARVYFIPGPPFRLAYRFQPYTTAVDNIFIPPVTIQIFDSLDNKMWTDTNQVSLALIPFGVLNGTTTVTERSGDVEFPVISISNGGSYVMQASLPPYGLTVNSLSFDIFENLYFGGDGDGHEGHVAREQNLKGQFALRIGGTFVAQGKVYDGTTNLGGTGVLSSALTLRGLVPEFPGVVLDSVNYRFISPAIGENRVVLVNNLFLSGADILQYVSSLSDGPSGFATIKGQNYFGGNGRGDNQLQGDTLFLDGVEPIPARLRFEPGPGDQLANEPFRLSAQLLSADNRIVPFGLDTAIMAFFANPTSAVLGGTITRGLTGGKAVFDDITIDRRGTGFQLSVEALSPSIVIDSSVSDAFDVYQIYSGGEGRGDTALSRFSIGVDGVIYDGWLGGAPGNANDWKTAANWSSQLTPRDTSKIIIPSRPNLPRLQRSATPALNSYVLASGGWINLLEDATLTIDSGTTGGSAADGPLFRIESGAEVITRGDNSKIIIEPNARYVNLSASNPRLESRQRLTGVKGWRQLTAPVRTTYADFLDSLETQGYAGAKYDSLQPNVLWWAETDTGTSNQSWRKPANATDSVLVGRGHFVYVFDGAAYPARVTGGGNYRDTLPVTLTATGFEADLTSDFTFPELTFTERTLSTVADTVGGNRFFLDENVADAGWNLLGNPTASVLNWDETGGAWTMTNLNNTFYIWDPALSGVGGYRYWNGTVGNINDTTLETGFLAPWQSFWVHANAANPELKVNNLAKSDSSQRFYSRTQSKPPHVAFTVNGQGMQANSFVSFGWEGITGPDRYDGYQLESYNDDWLMLYSNSSPRHRKPLVINHLPDQFNEELAVPLHLSAAKARAPISGNYSLSWKVSANWPAHWGLALMDHYKEEVIILDQRSKHEFTYDAPVQPQGRVSGENDEFRVPGAVLHQKPSDPNLPIFRQQAAPKRPFTLVVIPNYTGEPIKYRPDHPYLYPPTPNPFNEETKLAFYLPSAAQVTLEVTDMYGRMVSRLAQQEFAAGTHEVMWTTAHLKAGTYAIRLVTSDFVSTQKGVKIR